MKGYTQVSRLDAEQAINGHTNVVRNGKRVFRDATQRMYDDDASKRSVLGKWWYGLFHKNETASQYVHRVFYSTLCWSLSTLLDDYIDDDYSRKCLKVAIGFDAGVEAKEKLNALLSASKSETLMLDDELCGFVAQFKKEGWHAAV